MRKLHLLAMAAAFALIAGGSAVQAAPLSPDGKAATLFQDRDYGGDRYDRDDNRGDDGKRQRRHRDRDKDDNDRGSDMNDNDRNRGQMERTRHDNRRDFDQDRRFHRDRRFDRRDWSRFRRNLWSDRRFDVDYYRGPSGWRYHRYRYGDRLPRAFFVTRFWLTDFWHYGLFPPPPGLIWVRYGPDALLIDRYTGEIIQVRYNVFY